MNDINIFEIVFDKASWELKINTHSVVIFVVVAIFLIWFFVIRRRLKNNKVKHDFTPVKFKYKIGGAEIEYQIERNYQNIEIAHRAYVELITRKAAILVDEDKDVITEVYDSWYNLFKILREEAKKISGKSILDDGFSNTLMERLVEVLNLGLRPHLTEYQAKFRKWYSSELDKNPNLSPQEIQKQYPEYEKLITSMKEVNKLLIQYAEQLNNLIKGKS